jgi:general secretion pathway protein H
MSNADRRDGFTLIEVMAVMMIIALASTLVFAMSPGTGRAGLKATVFETAALLRRERESAILSGRDRGVALDSQLRTFIGQTGGTVVLPRDVALDVLGADWFSGTKRAVVQFHPDGASSGAALKFTREQAGYLIRVNWFTGGVVVDAL